MSGAALPAIQASSRLLISAMVRCWLFGPRAPATNSGSCAQAFSFTASASRRFCMLSADCAATGIAAIPRRRIARSMRFIGSPFLQQRVDAPLEIITDGAKPQHRIAGTIYRIRNGPVLQPLRAEPDRAIVRSGVADCDDDIKGLVKKRFGGLRLRTADVDTLLGHGRNGH